MSRFAILAALAALTLTAASAAPASEPSWSMAVNPLSPESQQIRQKPILERPNRPFHIYGNTVRRLHYRGNPLPAPREFSAGAGGMFGR